MAAEFSIHSKIFLGKITKQFGNFSDDFYA